MSRAYKIKSGYEVTIKRHDKVTLNNVGNVIKYTKNDNNCLGTFSGMTWIDKDGIPQSSDDWFGGTVYDDMTTPHYAWLFGKY